MNTGTRGIQGRDQVLRRGPGGSVRGRLPNGPWQVSVNPPKQVEKIPPSNPRYNAKYVKVYDVHRRHGHRGLTRPATPAPTWTTARWFTAPATSYPGLLPAPEAVHPAPGHLRATPPPMIPTPVPGATSPPITIRPAGWSRGWWRLAAGVAVGAAAPWWGHGPNYVGRRWLVGAGGYNNININNIHNNVINWPGPGPHPPAGDSGRLTHACIRW